MTKIKNASNKRPKWGKKRIRMAKDELDSMLCCGAPRCRHVEICISDKTAFSVGMFLQSPASFLFLFMVLLDGAAAHWMCSTAINGHEDVLRLTEHWWLASDRWCSTQPNKKLSQFFFSYFARESVWCRRSNAHMKYWLPAFPRRTASSLCLVSHRTLIPALQGPWTPQNPAAAPPTLPPQLKASSNQDNTRVKHFPSCISQLLFVHFFPLRIWVCHWTLHKLNNYLLHLYFLSSSCVYISSAIFGQDLNLSSRTSNLNLMSLFWCGCRVNLLSFLSPIPRCKCKS